MMYLGLQSPEKVVLRSVLCTAHTCSLPSLPSAEALLRVLLTEGVGPLATPCSSQGQSSHLNPCSVLTTGPYNLHACTFPGVRGAYIKGSLR